MKAFLLPNGKQQFIDINGKPLVGGRVYFYVQDTLTPKDTWQDPDETILNENPVTLDSRGQALIYGSGIYRQILKDVDDNLIWDQLSFGGTGGSGFGAQVPLISNATTDLGSTPNNNVLVTGTTTITSFGTSASLSSPVYLVEFQSSLTLTNDNTALVLPNGNNIITQPGDFGLFLFTDVAGYWRLIFYSRANGQPLSFLGPETAIASDTVTDLGTAGSNLVKITGNTSITNFGNSASLLNPLYFIRFAASLTLTYDATALQIPGMADVLTQPNDFAIIEFLGSGNWRILSYQVANGQSLSMSGATVTVASSATVDLGAQQTNSIAISGTNTITSFGSTATLANPIYFLRFTGILVLTNANPSLQLPGGQNITTANGDSAIAEYVGSSNWIVRQYTVKANGVGAGSAVQTYYGTISAGTLTQHYAAGGIAVTRTSTGVFAAALGATHVIVGSGSISVGRTNPTSHHPVGYHQPGPFSASATYGFYVVDLQGNPTDPDDILIQIF